MDGRNHHNIVTILQLKTNFKKEPILFFLMQVFIYLSVHLQTKGKILFYFVNPPIIIELP